jgi:hypothetical protein
MSPRSQEMRLLAAPQVRTAGLWFPKWTWFRVQTEPPAAWFKNHWLQITLKGAKAALAKGFRICIWSVTLI